MAKRKVESTNGQRGSAFILVLIALALGSLLVTPTINYVSTGLVETRISEELFDWLDAPVRRVAAKDTWIGYSPVLEDAILPQTNDVLEAIVELAEY